MAYGSNHLHLISLLSTLLYCWQCPGWWPRCVGSSPPSPGWGRWSWLPCSPAPAAGPAPTRACCQPYDDDDDNDDDDDDPPDHGVDGVQVPGLRVLDNLGEEGATHPLPRSRGSNSDHQCSFLPPVPAEAPQQADEQLVVVRQLTAHRARLVCRCTISCIEAVAGLTFMSL